MEGMKPCQSKVPAFSVRQQTISNSLSLESGNMIIMALSYAQKTGDKTHLTQYVINEPSLLYLSNIPLSRPPFLTSGPSFWSPILLFQGTNSALTTLPVISWIRPTLQSKELSGSRQCHRLLPLLVIPLRVRTTLYVHIRVLWATKLNYHGQSIAANYVSRWQTLSASSSGNHLTLQVSSSYYCID